MRSSEIIHRKFRPSSLFNQRLRSPEQEMPPLPNVRVRHSVLKLQLNLSKDNKSKQSSTIEFKSQVRDRSHNFENSLAFKGGVSKQKLKQGRGFSESILKMNNVIRQVHKDKIKESEFRELESVLRTPKSPILKQKGFLGINDDDLHKLLVSKPKIGEKLDKVLNKMILQLKEADNKEERTFSKKTTVGKKSQKLRKKLNKSPSNFSGDQSDSSFDFASKTSRNAHETLFPKPKFAQKFDACKTKFRHESSSKQNKSTNQDNIRNRSHNWERKEQKRDAVKNHSIQKKKHRPQNQTCSCFCSPFNETTSLKSILKKTTPYFEPKLPSFTFNINKKAQEQKIQSSISMFKNDKLEKQADVSELSNVDLRHLHPIVQKPLWENKPSKKVSFCSPLCTSNEPIIDTDNLKLNKQDRMPNQLPQHDQAKPSNAATFLTSDSSLEESSLLTWFSHDSIKQSKNLNKSKDAMPNSHFHLENPPALTQPSTFSSELILGSYNSEQNLDSRKDISLKDMISLFKIRTDSIDIQKRSDDEKSNEYHSTEEFVRSEIIDSLLRTNNSSVATKFDKSADDVINTNFLKLQQSKIKSDTSVYRNSQNSHNSTNALHAINHCRMKRIKRKEANAHQLYKKIEKLHKRDGTMPSNLAIQSAKTHHLKHVLNATTDYLYCNLKNLMERLY